MNNEPNPNMPTNPYAPNGGGYEGGYNNGGYQNGGYQGNYQGNMGYQNGYYNNGYQNQGGYQGQGNYPNQMMYSLDQISTPVTPTPEPKKRTGLIIGIAAAVAAVLVVILIVMMALPNEDNSDPVSAAVERLLWNEAPEYISISGNAVLRTTNAGDLVQSANFRLKSDLATGNLANSTVASLSLMVKNSGTMSLKLSETYTPEGNFFTKFDGVEVALKNSANSSSNATSDDNNTVSEEYLQCLADVENTNDCSELLGGGANNSARLTWLLRILEGFRELDGKWIRTTGNDMLKLMGGGDANATPQCAVGLVEDLHNRRESLAEAYSEYPFIYSGVVDQSDASLTNLDKRILQAITSETGISSNTYYDPEDYDTESEDEEEASEDEEAAGPVIYQVLLDEEILNEFIGATGEAGLSNLNGCWGMGDNKAAAVVASLPNVYVMFDEAGEINKIYFATALDSQTNVLVGLNLTYPTNINLTVPNNYTDLSTNSQNN